MLRKEDWMVIHTQVERGIYQQDIAAALGVHPRTVRRALARGGAPSGRRPGTRKSKLDPVKPEIDRLLQEGVWNAVVVLRELEAKGFRGEITLVRDYIRPKRALQRSRATVRFETAPRAQLQNDWGEVRTQLAGERRKVSFPVSPLGDLPPVSLLGDRPDGCGAHLRGEHPGLRALWRGDPGGAGRQPEGPRDHPSDRGSGAVSRNCKNRDFV